MTGFMAEFIKTTVVDQTYNTSYSPGKSFCRSACTAILGHRQRSSTAITMIMSIATAFSRLNIIKDALGPETAPVTWLL